MLHMFSHTKPTMATKHLIVVAFFVALTAIGAKIEIPLPYIPFTLQTFFVLLAGMILGPKLGALSQIAYSVLGLLGIPIFARGGGMGYVLQPTFGYILGFIPGAFVVGHLIQARSEVKLHHFLTASFCGLAVIYGFGLVYLWICANLFLHIELSLHKTLWVGLILLVPGAILKALLAAFLGVELRKRLSFSGLI